MSRYGDDDEDDKEDELAQRRAMSIRRDGQQRAADLFINQRSDSTASAAGSVHRSALGSVVCATCKFVGLEHYSKSRGCPGCEGKRNRAKTDRAADAIRAYKKAAESGDAGAERNAWKDVREHCGEPHANELAKAVASRMASKPSRPRGQRLE